MTNPANDEGGEEWVITGQSARGLINDAEEVASSPDARIKIRKKGNSVTLQWVGEGYTGPPWDDSSPCPGSPGC